MPESNYSIASNPKLNIWVSASAGSGKTKTLTDRFLRLLLNGVAPEKILCVTFTKVAAAEMLTRIRDTLSRWTSNKESALIQEIKTLTNADPSSATIKLAKSLFDSFIDNQDRLQIQTIHSFCQKLLSQFPIEAGLNSKPIILTEHQNYALIEKTKYSFLDSYEEAIEDPSHLNYLLENIHENTFDSLIERAVYINSISNTVDGKECYIEKLKELLNFSPNTAPTQKIKILKDIQNIINSNLSILKTYEKDNNKSISIALSLAHKNLDIEQFSTLKSVFLTQDFKPRASLISKKLASTAPSLLKILEGIQSYVLKYHNLKASEKTFRLTHGFLDLIELFNIEFKKIKHNSGCVDYNDLIQLSLKLLNDETISTWIESKLNTKISHIMVDESQDVNMKQWQIIYACLKDFFSTKTHNPNTIFIVGDQKQSIYSFQGSSPEIFHGMKQFIGNKAEYFENKLHELSFTHSFRSDALILSFVDKVFENITNKNPNYFCEENLKHISNKTFLHSSIELWPVVLGKEKEKITNYEWSIATDYENIYDQQRVLAKLIARKVNQGITSGEFLPSDFMILVRKRDILNDYIVQELKSLNIPVNGTDRLILNDNIAIKDLLSLMQFILLPQDDYNLACLLKSPLFYISEEELLELCQRGENTLWDSIKDHSTKNASLHKIYSELANILVDTELHSPYALMMHILNNLGKKKDILARLGLHTEDILDEFLNICLEFEETECKSLLLFTEWFQNSKIEIKQELDTNKNEVKIMTAHAAKGLQAKFVILPDTTSVPKNQETVIYDHLNDIIMYNLSENTTPEYKQIMEELKIRTLQEYYRLLYVALTRASEHLLICGHSTSKAVPDLSWYKIMEASIESFTEKSECTELSGYKNSDSYLNEENFFIGSSSYMYKKETGTSTYSHKETEQNIETALPDFLKAKYQEKHYTHSVSPSSSLSNRSEEIDYAISVGKLYHKALEYFVPIKKNVSKGEIEKFIGLYKPANISNLSNKKLENLAKVVNDIILPIAHNTTIETELKINRKVQLHGENYVISGSIDLLLVSNENIKIIDYKTDKFIPNTSSDINPKHINQLTLYKNTISEIYPNTEIECYIVWTHSPAIMKVEDKLLLSKNLELI